jgi:hypothetical protein
MKMENYIIPFSGLCLVALFYIVFRKGKKSKFKISIPEDKFIGSTYIPDLNGKLKRISKKII